MNSLVKATAAVTVLAAAAAAAYISSAPLSPGFLSSPPFLWLAANVIIIWLFSSSSRRPRGTSSAGQADDDVLNAVDDLYPSSDYEGFAAVVPAGGGEAPVVSKPKRQARDSARRTDRDRLPKKPAARTAAVETRWTDADDKKRSDETPRNVAAVDVEARPEDNGGDDDVSLDSLWQSMLQRRAVRPVAVRKSETWGNDELPRLQRTAETAAKRREMRKSVSSAAPPPQPEAAPSPSAVRQLGWRTRDVLVRAQDDLLRRAESLIRRHHEQLRLQRQESEQRQAMEQQRGRPPALIRV